MNRLIFCIFLIITLIDASNSIYGKASWYGSKFHGKLMASGKKYNMYDYIAAHKTLPLGTLIKVTNLKNNRCVYVKVMDRGPYVKGRVLDLSYLAAKKIGLIKSGVAKVKIDIVKDTKSFYKK